VLSVIIVSFNTREITLECLRRLYGATKPDFEVILVDNKSEDGSVEAIKSAFPEVKLIANQQNVGFAKANNQGMRLAKGDLILLLNSDVYLESDTIDRCLNYIKLNSVDVLGCKLVYPNGVVQSSTGYFPTLSRVVAQFLLLDDLPFIKDRISRLHSRISHTQEVDWVQGAFFLAKRWVWEKTNGFDESFFMYGEEVEWQKRIKEAGGRIWYYVDAVATHLGGASTKSLLAMFSGEIEGYQLWFRKYGTQTDLRILSAVVWIGCWLRMVVFGLTRKTDYAQAYWRVLTGQKARL
jgi:GT2 family glycosyltransferase